MPKSKYMPNCEVTLFECPVITPTNSCKKHVLAAFEKCQKYFPYRGLEILFVNVNTFMVNPTFVFGQMFYRSKHNKRFPILTQKRINRLRKYLNIVNIEDTPAAKKIFPDSDLTLGDLALVARTLVSQDFFWYTLLTKPQKKKFIDYLFKDELFRDKLLEFFNNLTTSKAEDPVTETPVTVTPVIETSKPAETPATPVIETSKPALIETPAQTKTPEDPVFPQLLGRMKPKTSK